MVTYFIVRKSDFSKQFKQIIKLWYNVDVIGYNVDVIWYIVDVIGYNVDVIVYNVDVIGYNVDVIGYNVDVMRQTAYLQIVANPIKNMSNNFEPFLKGNATFKGIVL